MKFLVVYRTYNEGINSERFPSIEAISDWLNRSEDTDIENISEYADDLEDILLVFDLADMSQVTLHKKVTVTWEL